jgi:hypothetical protein
VSTIKFAPASRVRLPAPPWVYERRLLARAEVDDAGCWLWTGPEMPNGYGSGVRAWGKAWLPHRLAYTVMVGEIPPGYQVDHLCRKRTCIRPFDLEAVTQAENLRRQGAAVTHCPAGHEYTAANTYRSPAQPTLRRCRTCARERQRSAA